MTPPIGGAPLRTGPGLPRVKVCGLTRVGDIVLAHAAGADTVGLVHYSPSPRHVDAHGLRTLLRDRPVGLRAAVVLVDEPVERARALTECADFVQLCGAEAPEDFAGFPRPILRRVPVDEGAEDELAAWSGIAAGFVLDHPAGPGGTGRGVSLDRAAHLASLAPCLLAGGLDGDVVRERTLRVRPRGVDASSRLEARPGHKDPERLRTFVDRARATLADLEGASNAR